MTGQTILESIPSRIVGLPGPTGDTNGRLEKDEEVQLASE